MNELERIRLKLGISRPQILRLIGARETREWLFRQDTDKIDPIFVQRTLDLEGFYDSWRSGILKNINPDELYTAAELARVLNTYTEKVLRFRALGILRTTLPIGITEKAQRTISGSEIISMFDANEVFLARTPEEFKRARFRRAPLSLTFMNWVVKHRPSFVNYHSE